MNIGQTLMNIGLMYLITMLKGGAAATAASFESGQPVTAAKITIGPGQVVAVTVQLEA